MARGHNGAVCVGYMAKGHVDNSAFKAFFKLSHTLYMVRLRKTVYCMLLEIGIVKQVRALCVAITLFHNAQDVATTQIEGDNTSNE